MYGLQSHASNYVPCTERVNLNLITNSSAFGMNVAWQLQLRTVNRASILYAISLRNSFTYLTQGLWCCCHDIKLYIGTGGLFLCNLLVSLFHCPRYTHKKTTRNCSFWTGILHFFNNVIHYNLNTNLTHLIFVSTLYLHAQVLFFLGIPANLPGYFDQNCHLKPERKTMV